MTDQSIFGNGQTEQNTQQTERPSVETNTQSQNGLSHLLTAIKNEKGETKYGTVEDALKGAAHAQELILKNHSELSNLRAEVQRLREENAEYKGAVSAMNSFNQPSQPAPQSQPAKENGSDEVNLEELVSNVIKRREDGRTAEANIRSVAVALKEKFGDKAEESFYQKASELGLTRQAMNNLAAQSPTAVLAFFEGKQATNINPTQTSVNTAAMPPTNAVDLKAPLPRGEKSVLLGMSQAELIDEMRRHKERVDKMYGVIR